MTGKPGVSPETRNRVLAIARELGYTPDPSARSRRSPAVPIVGIVVALDKYVAGPLLGAEAPTDRPQLFPLRLLTQLNATLAENGVLPLLAHSLEESPAMNALVVISEDPSIEIPPLSDSACRSSSQGTHRRTNGSVHELNLTMSE